VDSEFLTFIGFVIDHEGRSFENDPNDHGNTGDGKTPGNYGTKFGIDAESHPGVNIVNLTEDQAIAIYWSEWQAERVDAISHPADLVYFDDSVNAGNGDATRILQKALNELAPAALAVDGVLGPLTLAAAARSDGPKLAMGMLSLRDEHYQLIAQDDPREAVYLQGWLNRVSDLQRWISGFPIV
jgi:lysozyme family protein